jgi:hypothetical protein
MSIYTSLTGIVTAVFLVIGTSAAAAQNPAFTDEPVRIATDDTVVSIQAGDRVLLRYRYRDVPFKPYVQEFFTPLGVNILRDAPHDHLHHHALMFAIAVNRVDFWAETKASGRQEHRGFVDVKTDKHNDVSWAEFTEHIDWIDPQKKELLLKERRTIQVPQAKQLDASLLTWQSTLEVPPGKESVSLTGSHYFGLGMRFLQSMDGVGQFLNAGTDSVEVVRGDERNFRSTWCAYTAEADGKTVTAAMFDHPDNPRHPATWFTMAKSFAYLSATLNLHKEALEMTADNPLTVRYGVALWDGRIEADRIDRLYRRWVSWSPPAAVESDK